MARRGVFKPPYAAARSLIEWAVDLWPYVNGKGLVHGMKIAEMEGTEMLDVIHYFFEDDLLVSTSEEVEAKSTVRTTIYEDLYGVRFKYKLTPSSKNYNAGGGKLPDDGFYGAQEINEFDPDPVKKVTKPYVPPTEFNPDSPMPFGRTLDAPLG